MFGRAYASQDDVDDCLSRIVTVNDLLMTNLPRIATLESRFSHMTAKQETMQKQLDRQTQRRNLLAEAGEMTGGLAASAPPLTADLAAEAPKYTDAHGADSKPAVPAAPASSHRGEGSLPSPAGPGKFSSLVKSRITPPGSVKIEAVERPSPLHTEAPPAGGAQQNL